MYKRSIIVPNIILLIVIGLCGLAPYGAAQGGQSHQPTAFSSIPPLLPVQSLSSGPQGVKMKPGTRIQIQTGF